MRSIVLGVGGIAVLIFSGIVQGLWTDRWSDRSDLIAAAARLDRFPLTLGEWQGTDYEQTADKTSAMAGVLSRRYVHPSTGNVVSIYIGCGRPGPVSVHTPDVCYAGSGYQIERPTAFAVPPGPDMPKGELWTARFVKEKADSRSNLRLFWSWHTAGGWKVADNPRLAFAGEKQLYKLYVIREMATADEPIDTDPCIEFMRVLLPALEATQFVKE